MTNFNHFNIEQRNTIQYLLGTCKSFTEIGKCIGKDRTSIAKEVKRNRYSKYSTSNSNTSECKKLDRFPACCNFCESKAFCRKNKLYYNAKIADEKANLLLKDSRRGINISENVIEEIETSLIPLIKNQKQSINQIYINHDDVLYFSKTTFYKYINIGCFSINNCDLPRKVKYKKRKDKVDTNYKRKLKLLKGRKYSDYINFINKHPRMNIIQMDTVIGSSDDTKCLLTLFIKKTHFMLIFLLNKKCVEEVDKKITEIKNTLGIKLYAKVFRILLTDNGCEFFNPLNFEYDYINCKKVSNLFYCEPYSSWQKTHLEHNHEYIRRVFPKGISLENISPSTIKKLEDNINNVPRISLNNKTPYELTKELYPDLIKKLNCSYIEPDKVTLNPNDFKN